MEFFDGIYRMNRIDQTGPDRLNCNVTLHAGIDVSHCFNIITFLPQISFDFYAHTYIDEKFQLGCTPKANTRSSSTSPVT